MRIVDLSHHYADDMPLYPGLPSPSFHDFAQVIKELTGGKGVNVVLDMVGAQYFAANLRCLGMDGRLVIIAFLSGSKVEEADLTSIMSAPGGIIRP